MKITNHVLDALLIKSASDVTHCGQGLCALRGGLVMGRRFFFLLFVGLCLLLTGCQESSEHIALGTLERDRLTLNALVSERLMALPIKEGDEVKAGQLLARFDDRYANAQLDLALAQLKQAQAALSEAENGSRAERVESAYAAWRAAQANYEEAQRQYLRSKELFNAKAVGQAALDNARALRDQTKAQAEQSQQQWLELKNGAREEVLAQLRAQVDAAQARVDAAQVSLEHYQIIAPQAATVDSLPWHEGDTIVAGALVFGLISKEAPYARVYLPAEARQQLHRGATVKVTIDGYKTPFTGVVRNIRSQPAYTPYYALNEKERSQLMYLTDINVQNADQVPTGVALEVHLP